MNWIPLRVVAGPVLWLLAVGSVMVLLRGHNEPGGGFIGGLLGAAGFLVYALANGARSARRLMRYPPTGYLGLGLLLAVGGGLFGLVRGEPFLTGQWWFSVPAVGKIGSVLVFDLGVYLVVFGGTLLVLLGLLDEDAAEGGGP